MHPDETLPEGATPDDVPLPLIYTEPLPHAEVWAHAETWNGVTLVWLGEDGEQAMADGHVDLEAFAAALREVTGEDADAYTTDAMSHTWMAARRHMTDCQDGLMPGETCDCDQADWVWWGDLVAEGTPGAVPVTYWSC